MPSSRRPTGALWWRGARSSGRWPRAAGTSSSPGARGGWSFFITRGSGEGFDNPIGLAAHTANGEAGWFGWPKDDVHEKLRDDWALAATLNERMSTAAMLKRNAWPL